MTDLLATETKTKASKEASPSLSQAMYASRMITSIKIGDKIANPETLLLREVTRKEEISATKKIATIIAVIIDVIIAVMLNRKETQSKVKPCTNLS